MPHKLYKILLILGIAACITAIFAFWLTFRVPDYLEVDFLDVGQGDAELIQTPFGQNILIDGGPGDKALVSLGRALPWWDRKIDLMILTHPHDDHVTGLIEVLKRYEVKKILYTGVIHTAPNYIAWLETVRDKKIKLTIIDRPQTIELGENCRLEIIYPNKSLLGRTVENLNNSSIIARLVYKENKFLFMGDAEEVVEKELLEQKTDLKADVIKIGHHGSTTSTSEDFLWAVRPVIAVIEVGAENEFGHPNARIIKRLENIGVEILRTDLLGNIRLKSDGINVEIKKD